ncbi:hypothetical protein AHF37_11360 [Paragonimus kellicotti]|nr:hypothetical protein AHF37_11360 [Paragonimus kellicotti]
MSRIFSQYRALGLCTSDVPFIIKYAAHSSTYYALVPTGQTFNVYKLPRLTLVGISKNDLCFQEFSRALGLCTSDVPFIIKYAAHSSTYYALVPTGQTFNVYKLPRLTLVGISDPVHHDIRAFACSQRLVFAAADNAHELRGHNDKIKLMIVFSGFLLASLDEGCLLKVWNVNSCEVVFSMQFSSKSFNITAISNPLGYKNKLLLGSSQGPLQLWNVKSQKQLYWFKGFGAPVSCIAQAPAVDVCAVGLADGRVCLHNIKYDTTLLNFLHDGGAVTAVSFRNGEFVSYFDRPDGGPRTVYKRSGHFRPPNRVNFWPGGSAGGSLLLSAGQDSMLRYVIPPYLSRAVLAQV